MLSAIHSNLRSRDSVAVSAPRIVNRRYDAIYRVIEQVLRNSRTYFEHRGHDEPHAFVAVVEDFEQLGAPIDWQQAMLWTFIFILKCFLY